MTTILFVHGTGVRREALEDSLAEIRRQVATWGNVRVLGCDWGEEFGTSLHAGGASVPTFDATRAAGVGGVAVPDAEWVFLLADPLAELRLLALSAGAGGDDGDVSPFEPAGEELKREFKSFASIPIESLPDPLFKALEKVRLTKPFEEARGLVAGSDAFEAALNTAAKDALDHYREVLAYAVIAQAVVLDAGLDLEDRLDPKDRLQLVSLVEAAIAKKPAVDRDRSPLTSLKYQAKALAGAVALSVGTFGLKRYRGKATEAMAKQIGDVLYYQQAGDTIRKAIARDVRAAGTPVILCAHSLGGIAAVELLAEDPSLCPLIELFVTAGSQFSFLYELGALRKLPYTEDPPVRTFPPWINFFDLSDFLSYVACHEKLFGNLVEDVQVFSRRRFPDSHGWYIKDADVLWKTVHDRLLRVRAR